MRPQSRELFCGELEHEIRRKLLGIAFDCLIESLGFHPIQRGQIGIDNDPLTAQHLDPVCHERGLGSGLAFCLNGATAALVLALSY